MKSIKVTNRKSKCSPQRGCYLSADGKFYCYQVWDPDLKSMVEQKLEVGNDLSVDWTLLLDEMDHELELNDFYEGKIQDPRFKQKMKDFDSDPDSEDAVDPWEEIRDERMAPETVFFAEGKQESPDVLEVRRIIEEKCTEDQKNLFYAHFGEERTLKEIRLEEEESGRKYSHQAITNRKDKIIRKVAKALGKESSEENHGSNKD